MTNLDLSMDMKLNLALPLLAGWVIWGGSLSLVIVGVVVVVVVVVGVCCGVILDLGLAGALPFLLTFTTPEREVEGNKEEEEDEDKVSSSLSSCSVIGGRRFWKMVDGVVGSATSPTSSSSISSSSSCSLTDLFFFLVGVAGPLSELVLPSIKIASSAPSLFLFGGEISPNFCLGGSSSPFPL